MSQLSMPLIEIWPCYTGHGAGADRLNLRGTATPSGHNVHGTGAMTLEGVWGVPSVPTLELQSWGKEHLYVMMSHNKTLHAVGGSPE